MFATAMQEQKTITAQEKWTGADQFTRTKMLQAISYSASFANLSWSKLPGLVRQNLNRRTWTA